MIPPVEAAEICVAVPVAICLVAPLGCLVGALFLGGLAMAPVACILLPLACCLPCTLCCCPQTVPNAGDETGPGLYTDRPVFYTPYGTAVYTRGGLYDDGEIFIVNSTVFQSADARDAALGAGGGASRRGGVVITELPPDEDSAAAASGKQKAA
jgi:hypothetical protein